MYIDSQGTSVNLEYRNIKIFQSISRVHTYFQKKTTYLPAYVYICIDVLYPHDPKMDLSATVAYIFSFQL